MVGTPPSLASMPPPDSSRRAAPPSSRPPPPPEPEPEPEKPPAPRDGLLHVNRGEGPYYEATRAVAPRRRSEMAARRKKAARKMRSVAEKQAIVAELLDGRANGTATIASMSKKHGVATSLLSRWLNDPELNPPKLRAHGAVKAKVVPPAANGKNPAELTLLGLRDYITFEVQRLLPEVVAAEMTKRFGGGS